MAKQTGSPLGQRGFTLVELVIAITLLGIISVSVSSRWFNVDTFHSSSLQAQLIAEARLAQRTALANSQLAVSFVISQDGADWRYQIFTDNGGGRTLMRQTIADTGGVGIDITAGSTLSLSPTVDFDLTYDGYGNLSVLAVGGSSLSVTNGVQIDLAGARMCLSPLGYAHAGDCV